MAVYVGVLTQESSKTTVKVHGRGVRPTVGEAAGDSLPVG